MARKIEVVDYNPEWEKEFKQEAKKIKAILGKNCVGIHHIGSTSVKGMKAKPIIDIMPIVKDLSLVDEHNKAFEALGYECKGEYGIPGRRFYMKGGDDRTHHIHIFSDGNKKDTGRHLAVREYLRAHPETAKEYGELKAKLAEEFTYDIDGYCDGKDAFMKEVEAKAVAWSEKEIMRGNNISMGMCMGLCLGTAVGSALGNLVMGTSIGLCLGLCAGTIIGNVKIKK